MEQVSWLKPLHTQIFATTRWSVVRACRQSSKAQAQEALAEICQTYWRAVYACIRHHGHSTHDAQDLTQDFFVQLLGGKYFVHLDQAKGRFRAYLAVALRNFLHDQRRRRWTWRRGRGISIVSLEAQEAEHSYTLLPVTCITPQSLYERHWARTVIELTLGQLKIEMAADRKELLYEHFDAMLTGDTRSFPYEAVAAASNLTIGALHVALYRWRRRFQVLMREEIARTVASKSEIDDEIVHLMAIVAHTE